MCGATADSVPVMSTTPSSGAGVGVVERHGGAAPRMDGALVVFGTGNLDTAAQCQGGSGGAGANAGLGPVGAGHEHHAFGAPLRHGIPLHPEEAAHLIAHGDQQAAVVAGQDQEFMDDGHDGGQGMLPAVFLQLLPVQGQWCFGVVRIGPELDGTLPGFLHQAPQPGQVHAPGAAGAARGIGAAGRAEAGHAEQFVARQGMPLEKCRGVACPELLADSFSSSNSLAGTSVCQA